MQITPSQLRAICPKLSAPRSKVLSDLFNELAPKYKMDTADKAHEFIAQAAHESAEFTHKDENLNYSAERLVQVWPSRFPTIAAAKPYARDSQKLANKVYADRMGNGNEASGDGFMFRGGGFIHISGRDIYTKFAKYREVDVLTVPRLVRTEDRWALDSALWLFCVEKRLLDEAERDEFVTITRDINGGLIGLEDRKKYYERAKLVLKSLA